MDNRLRLFGRRRTVSTDAAPDAQGGAGGAASPAAGMPVIDRAGQAFEIVRESELGMALWRVAAIEDVPGLGTDTVVLYAAYDWADLDRAAALMRRQPTVVLGMGLGAHAGSRALNLGAIGYLHDGLARDQLGAAFADALARQRYRHIRTTGRVAMSAQVSASRV